MKIKGSTIEQLEKNKPKSKCRKWRLWVTTEVGRKSRRFAGTWTEAQNALRAFVKELEGKVPSSDNFGVYATSWLVWREQSGRYAPNTVANDKRCVNALKRTHLWKMSLDAITPQDCRDALTWMKSNPARAEKLTNTSMAKIHGALSLIMGQAHADGLCSSNPMASVEQPKIDRKDREAFSPDALMLVVGKLCEMPLDAHVMACLLMACLGLRRSEALALLDADIADGYCRIHQAVKERNGAIDEPKSKAGNRTLPMPPVLQDKVAEWRGIRRAKGLADALTLCCNKYGGTMRPQNFQRWWDAHREDFMCDGYTTHQLRHSNLSMVARFMSPFDLQRYAGWSSLGPARIYIHDDLDAVSRAVGAAWEDSTHQKRTT